MSALETILKTFAHHEVMRHTLCFKMQGENPSVQEALDVYHILTEGNNDLRQPVGLETQLLKESSMDSEVGMSMLQLLSVYTFTS